MASADEKKKMVTLQSSDGELFEVEEAVALQSETIKNMVEDGCADSAIPLPNVTSKILAMVIQYCMKHHHADAASESSSNDKNKELAESGEGTSSNRKKNKEAEKSLKKWDAEFVKVLDRPTLFELILAANFLNIEGLLYLTCKVVADSIKDRSLEESRQILNIKSDYTPEEEAKFRKENAWAFES